MADAAKISVRRGGRYADRFRRYRIYVNGILVGCIWPKSILQLEVPVGALTIEAKIDWCSGEPLHLVLGVGDAAEVEVSNSHGMAGAAVGMVFWDPETYLTIVRLN